MKRLIYTLFLSLLLLLALAGSVAARSYPWSDHQMPFDFLFGNHIDTHQQTNLVNRDLLRGFFYIKYTGEMTEEGVPFATHANCSNSPEECSVGWLLQGIPARGKFIAHEEGQHPTWCLDPEELPMAPDYSHFHWLNESEHAGGLTIGETYDGYMLRLIAIDNFFFEHHGGFLVEPGFDEVTHANIVTDCE